MTVTTAVAAIVPAAGYGSRMQHDKPKQYLRLAGQEILLHTLTALLQDPRIKHIFIAIAGDDPWFESLELPDHWPLTRVAGGHCRAASVAAGVAAAAAAGYSHVAVHDAARPCLRSDDLARVISAGLSSEAGALLALPLDDTLKRADATDNSESTVDRQQLWRAMTPQVFATNILQRALQQIGVDDPGLTDEASAVERCGYKPKLVTGSATNIKVTRPADLELARLYLEAASATDTSVAEAGISREQ